MDLKELDFTYESSENFRTVPAYPIVSGDYAVVMDLLERCPGVPKLHPGKLLHVGVKLDLLRPMPDGEPLGCTGELVDVVDVILKFSLFNKDNQVLNVQHLTFFIRGLGGFRSKTHSDPMLPQPTRPANHTTVQPAQSSLALSPLWRQTPAACEQGSSANCRF